MCMHTHNHAKEFTRVIGGNIRVNLLSTDHEQIKNTIYWAFPDIEEVEIGNSKYFVQDGKIYNATIDYNTKQVIMVKEK